MFPELMSNIDRVSGSPTAKPTKSHSKAFASQQTVSKCKEKLDVSSAEFTGAFFWHFWAF